MCQINKYEGTYDKVNRNPTSAIQKRISAFLQKLKADGILSQKEYFKMYTSNEIPLSFYGLPKPTTPLRPIVSSCGAPTHRLASYLDPILRPLTGKTDSFVRNSADFANKIKEVKLLTGETITSYDVTSLFTCIPLDGIVAAIRKRLEDDETLPSRTPLSVDNICDMLTMCLTCTYFIYKDSYYKQKHGGAIGSPMSQAIADVYVVDQEQITLREYPGSAPRIWMRYVDDTFVVIKEEEKTPFFG